MDSFLPAEGVEYYHYDQLETGDSDRPNDPDLWTLPRYVDEVDQVRKAIGGTKDNFCLLGHSWGGILAMEYALAHQDQMKCLVISNMTDRFHDPLEFQRQNSPKTPGKGNRAFHRSRRTIGDGRNGGKRPL